MSNGTGSFNWDDDWKSYVNRQQRQQRQAQEAEEEREDTQSSSRTTRSRTSRHPANAAFVSPDGRLSYDSRGRLLDSLGNLAFPTYGNRRRRRTSSADVGVGEAATATISQTPWGDMVWDYGVPGRVIEGQIPNYTAGSETNVPYPTLDEAAYQRLQNYISGVYLPIADRAQQNFLSERDFAEAQRQFDAQFEENVRRFGIETAMTERLRQQDFLEAQRRFNEELSVAQTRDAEARRQFNQQFAENQRRFSQEFPWRQRAEAFASSGRSFLPNSRFISTR